MDVATLVLKVAVALAATLALVVGGAVLARRLGVARGTNQIIRVLSSAALGSRERLLLIEVHGRQILVGVTAQHIAPVHVFGDDAPAIPDQAPDFRNTLRNLMPKPS